jgi:hypothetical protein
MLSDSQKRLIQKMWRKGYTGAQIAQSAGTTRNTVMGYVHRAVKAGLLTLKTVKNPPTLKTIPAALPEPKPVTLPVLKTTKAKTTYAITTIKSRIENATFKKQELETNPQTEINSKGVPLIKLREHHCRHIFDETATHESLYCGRDVFRRSYCEEHYLMFYVPSVRKLAAIKNANNTLIVRK